MKPDGFHYVLAFGLLALTACDSERPTSAAEENAPVPAHFGSARIQLPNLPAGYPGPVAIRDSSVPSSGGEALFRLTISGPGMEPQVRSWILQPVMKDPILISGIPEGTRRIFSGSLAWLDSNTRDTLITHEGADTVAIARGRVAGLVLRLRKVTGGSANICLEVEGWSDSSCVIVPPVPVIPPPPPDSADTLGNMGDTVISCWNVTQQLVNGMGGKGEFWLLQFPGRGSARGFFLWDGYPAMWVTNEGAPVLNSPLYLYGNMPAGMAGAPEDAPHHAHYKAKVAEDGSLQAGTIYQRLGGGEYTTDDAWGAWGGARKPCSDRATRFLLQGGFPKVAAGGR